MKIRYGGQIVIGLALLLVLGMLFVPECDDCYFVYWQYASWRDFLLTRPITEGLPVLGVPENGRYLGNLIGVVLGKLSAAPFAPLRGLLMGGAVAGLGWLLSCRMRSQRVTGGEAMALALSLLLLSSQETWQQIFSWGAALANYLIPMAGILLLFHWIFDRPAPRPLLAVTACACCLFLELITIYLVLAGLVLALWAWRSRREKLPSVLAVCGGSWAGAVIMAAAPGYHQVGSDLRGIVLDQLWENLRGIFTEALVRPVAAAILVSGLLLWLLWRQGCPRWPIWGGLLAAVHLGCLWDTYQDLFLVRPVYSNLGFGLGAALAVLWVVLLLEWNGGDTRNQVWGLVLSLCVVNGPLLVVSLLWPRQFFPSYVFLLWTAALLYRQAREQGLRPFWWSIVPAAVAGCVLVAVYGTNFQAHRQRMDYAQQQLSQGADAVTLPLLPYPQWAVNELPGKGDLSYLIYREVPWDVSLTFVPYEEFSAK